jgi:hypothetical protein
VVVTKHLKEVHGLVVEKVKFKRLPTSKGGPWYQNHAKMNVCILGDAMAMQRWIDQKVVIHIRVKTQREWDELIIVAQ